MKVKRSKHSEAIQKYRVQMDDLDKEEETKQANLEQTEKVMVFLLYEYYIHSNKEFKIYNKSLFSLKKLIKIIYLCIIFY